MVAIFQKKCIWLFLLCAFQVNCIYGQLYFETVGGIYPYNVCTCTLDPIVSPVGSNAIAIALNNNPYYLAGIDVFEYNLVTGISTLVGSVPNGGNNMVVDANGIIYVIGADGMGSGLSSINPITGITTDLGYFPGDYLPIGDLFIYGGELYCTMFQNSSDSYIVKIPGNDPTAAFNLFPITNGGGYGTASFILNGVETVFIDGYDGSGNQGLYTVDMATGTFDLICPNTTIYDLGSKTGASFPACCENYAGSFVQDSLLTACKNQPITLTHQNDQVLNGGSVLRFVLVSDSLAVPASVLAVSPTPSFNFNPATMTTGTTYFVAAVAAPLVNGAIDWGNVCFDIGYFVPVKWNALPAVAFEANNAPFCNNGSPLAITANFSGSPPFTLAYNVSGIGSFTQSYPGMSGVLEFTPPADFSGPIVVQATSLLDINCVCN